MSVPRETWASTNTRRTSHTIIATVITKPRRSNHKTWHQNYAQFSFFTFQLNRFCGVHTFITNWFRRKSMEVSAAYPEAKLYPDLCLESMGTNIKASIKTVGFQTKTRTRNLQNINWQWHRDSQYFPCKMVAHSTQRAGNGKQTVSKCQTKMVLNPKVAGHSIISALLLKFLGAFAYSLKARTSFVTSVHPFVRHVSARLALVECQLTTYIRDFH